MRGPGKGHTNNPNGRPVGSKNKVDYPIRQKLIEYSFDNINKLFDDINALELKESVKARIEILKLVTPRPVDPIDAANKESFMDEFKKRMFPSNEDNFNQ